jgi:hypothetical protein
MKLENPVMFKNTTSDVLLQLLIAAAFLKCLLCSISVCEQAFFFIQISYNNKQIGSKGELFNI